MSKIADVSLGFVIIVLVSQHGRERQVSCGPREDELFLFRKLAENFELCVFGLGYVRADLKRLRNPSLQRIWGTLLD